MKEKITSFQLVITRNYAISRSGAVKQ